MTHALHFFFWIFLNIYFSVFFIHRLFYSFFYQISIFDCFLYGNKKRHQFKRSQSKFISLSRFLFMIQTSMNAVWHYKLWPHTEYCIEWEQSWYLCAALWHPFHTFCYSWYWYCLLYYFIKSWLILKVRKNNSARNSEEKKCRKGIQVFFIRLIVLSHQ